MWRSIRHVRSPRSVVQDGFGDELRAKRRRVDDRVRQLAPLRRVVDEQYPNRRCLGQDHDNPEAIPRGVGDRFKIVQLRGLRAHSDYTVCRATRDAGGERAAGLFPSAGRREPTMTATEETSRQPVLPVLAYNAPDEAVAWLCRVLGFVEEPEDWGASPPSAR